MSINILTTEHEVETTQDVCVTKNDVVDVVRSDVGICNTINPNTVEAIKKEYSIVGDGLYASVSAEEAPLWLTGILDQVIDIRLGNTLFELNQANLNITNALSEVQIAKNSYEELINIDASIDAIVGSKIEQLQTQMNDSISSVTDLIATKVTPDQATAIAAQQLNSEIDEGRIKALATEISGTRADTASALAYINQTLSAGFNGISDSVSQLTNVVSANASQAMANFGYNANLTLGGVIYQSGFGLATSLVDPSMPTGYSEFWVNADKFKVAGATANGEVAKTVFSIDSTTGNVVIDGNVTIGNSTVAGLPVYYGSRSSAPTGSINEGSTYYNTSTGVVYTFTAGAWRSLQGLDGAPGATGSRGTAIGYGTSATTSAFTSSTGLPYPIYGDQLVVTDSSGTNIYSYNGYSWYNSTVMKINGNAVIDGTLSVSKIVGGTVASGMEFYLGSFINGSTKLSVFGKTSGTGSGGVGGQGFYGLVGLGTSYGGGGLYTAYGTLNDNGSSRAAFLSTSGWSADFRHSIRAGYNVGTSGAGGTNLAQISTAGHAGYFAGPVYIQSEATSFTGAHEGLWPKDLPVPEQGDILTDDSVFIKLGVSETMCVHALSSKVQEKSCVGVFNHVSTIHPGILTIEGMLDPFYKEAYSEYVPIIVNSIGEGLVNVCGLGGDIEAGDLITTSSIPGKGMKQSDDVVRNYTVAKSREDVTFDYPEQVRQVACVYMCG